MLDNMIFNANSITIPQGSVAKITDQNGVVLWQKENEPIVTTATPMYFENADLLPVTIGLTRLSSSAPLVTMEISTDGNNWELWGDSASSVERVIPVGGKAYIRATTNIGYFSKSAYTWNYFTSTGKVNVGGNIMSIGYNEFDNQTIITQDYAYNNMFFYMDKLVDASNLILPADVVSPYCYTNMFFACTQLKSSPKILPATTLDMNCYYCMFQRCTALATAPALPATQMEYHCYDHMFDGCSSLTTAPSLPADTLAIGCYDHMFYGCSRLTAAPALPATTLVYGCYQYMFNSCNSLTETPALPATTLAEHCYDHMFYYCRNINKVVIYANDIEADSGLNNWISYVSETGDFYNLGSAEYERYHIDGCWGIPTTWTEHKTLD